MVQKPPFCNFKIH